MVDFFANMARQVLHSEPEVRPLLPPKFAPWPGAPAANGPTWPPEEFDTPAQADAALFPPPLIDPDSQAASAPLPTFRQMSEHKPAVGPLVQPARPPVAQEGPEKADFEQGDSRQAVVTPVSPAVNDAQPYVPHAALASSPTSPVIQARAESAAEGAVNASPATRGPSGDRPSKEMATTQRDHVLSPAPRPAAGQERSASSAGLHEPPVRMGGLLRYSQAEPGNAQPELVPSRTEPVEAHPELVEGQTEPVELRPEPVRASPPELTEARHKPVKARTDPIRGHAELVGAGTEPVEARPEYTPAPLTVQPAASVPVAQRQAVPGDQPVEPLAPQLIPTTERDLAVSTQAEATPAKTSPALTTSSREPAPLAGRDVSGWREPAIVPAPEPAPGETGSTTPAEAESVEVQRLARAPSSAPLTGQRAGSMPVPVAQRWGVPGDQPVEPLAPQLIPATEPNLPVSTQGRATPAAPAPDLTNGSLESASPAGRAGWREPVIVPAPEPEPSKLRLTTLAEAGISLRPPSARPTTGEPEPAPTVRVTIGRVIVRSSSAAERAPSRRVKLPRPPLSLEEYLQGRQGGER